MTDTQSSTTSGAVAFELHDSRRLTGPNTLLPGAGAVVDVAISDADADRAERAWRARVSEILNAVGWGSASPAVRRFPGGMSLGFGAPIDALYAATEVNEWAWSAAACDLAGIEPGTAESDVEAAADAAARLRGEIAQEVNPDLIRLRDAAREHGVTFLSDDDHASVGLGSGSATWPARQLPDPERIEWSAIHDIPVALVTGTNGKTTTVRLLAAMAKAAGLIPGNTSTDGIYVDGTLIDAGDWSGPGGGRAVLRDPRVQLAVLETARGGMARRGVALPRASVAIVTNVAEDHLGEFGVHDVDGVARVKLVVGRAIPRGGRIVINADDPALVRNAEAASEAGLLTAPFAWFGIDPDSPSLRPHVEAGAEVATLQDGAFVYLYGEGRELGVPVDDVPLTLGGAARHNVYNCLGAIAVAGALRLPWDAVERALREFEGSAADNPGRGNQYELGGVRVFLDFAHNPHGMEALAGMLASLPGQRRLIILGQGGDRDDASIRELARTAWMARPDHVIVKELEKYLRGREPGEVPAIIESALIEAGAPPGVIEHADTEMDSVKQALRWAEPGDLILLIVHGKQSEATELLSRLSERGWKPGDELE